MSTKGRYVPDPGLVFDGVDYGKSDNDCGFDEAPDKPGSEEELGRFEFHASGGCQPEDLAMPADEKARYVEYLKTYKK